MMDKKKKQPGGCWGWCLLLVVLGGIAFAVFIFLRNSKSGSFFGPSGAISKNYVDALKIAIQFFDVQKCITSIFSLFVLFSDLD